MRLILKKLTENTLLPALIFIMISFSCEEAEEPDIKPPLVTITSVFNETVSDTVTVAMMASDNIGIEKVELWVDGLNSGLSDSTEPFEVDVNTLLYEDGNRILVARASDLAGNTTDSNPVVMPVQNQDIEAPTIQITSIFTNEIVSDTVTVTMMASDNIGIEKVELWVDGLFTGLSDSTEPFNFALNTRDLSNGSHLIVGRAYDLFGNVTDSETRLLATYNDFDPPVIETFYFSDYSSSSDTIFIYMAIQDESPIDSVGLLIDDEITSGYLEDIFYDEDSVCVATFKWPAINYLNKTHELKGFAIDSHGSIAFNDSIEFYTYNQPEIILQSDNTDITVGETFAVSILAERLNVFAITLKIKHNNSILSYNSATGFNSGLLFGEDNISFSASINSIIGLSNSLTQGQQEVSGFGEICSLEFNAESAGADTLSIIECFVFNSEGERILISSDYYGNSDSDISYDSILPVMVNE